MSVFECVLCVFFNTDAGIECVRLSVFLCVLCVSGVCSSVFPGKQVAGLEESYAFGIRGSPVHIENLMRNVRNRAFLANFEVRNVRNSVTFLRFLRFLTFSKRPTLTTLLRQKRFLRRRGYGGQAGGQTVCATGAGRPVRREARKVAMALRTRHVAAPGDGALSGEGTPRGEWIFDF